jgi:hypothetical protein
LKGLITKRVLRGEGRERRGRSRSKFRSVQKLKINAEENREIDRSEREPKTGNQKPVLDSGSGSGFEGE